LSLSSTSSFRSYGKRSTLTTLLRHTMHRLGDSYQKRVSPGSSSLYGQSFLAHMLNHTPFVRPSSVSGSLNLLLVTNAIATPLLLRRRTGISRTVGRKGRISNNMNLLTRII